MKRDAFFLNWMPIIQRPFGYRGIIEYSQYTVDYYYRKFVIYYFIVNRNDVILLKMCKA